MPRSFEYYCDTIEKVENYEAAKRDNFKGWDCHHRLETHNSDGEKRLVDITAAELVALDMYYNRPAEELIFLTKAEHNNLHHGGKQPSEETRKKISAANKGKPSPNKGKTFSEEQKAKLSAAMKGKYKGKNNPMYGQKHSEETRKKISAAMKGKKLGPMSEERKAKLSVSMKGKNKGKHWKLVDGKRVWY